MRDWINGCMGMCVCCRDYRSFLTSFMLLHGHWIHLCSPSGQSEATISLHDKVQELMFSKSCLLVLGSIPSQYSGMITRFNQFDGSFELASSEIPHIFLPAFTGRKESAFLSLSLSLSLFLSRNSLSKRPLSQNEFFTPVS